MLRTRFAVAALLGVALAAVAGGQDRAFTLALKDKDNKFVPFYQEMSTEVTQHIKVQGQDLPQQQKSTFWYAWTPVKDEKVKEGAEDVTKWTLKQKIEGLKMDIDISGNPIKYDSRTPDAAGSSGNPGLVEFFKSLKDSEFTVTLGKGYKVEKVDGKEEFIKKLGAGSAQMDALLKKVMTDDALKEMTDPTYKLLPDGAKKKGDKWEKKSNLNLGPIGAYELTYKFTYAEPDKEGDKKDFDKIEVETAINYTAPKDTTEGLLFRIKEGSKLTSDADRQQRRRVLRPEGPADRRGDDQHQAQGRPDRGDRQHRHEGGADAGAEDRHQDVGHQLPGPEGGPGAAGAAEAVTDASPRPAPARPSRRAVSFVRPVHEDRRSRLGRATRPRPLPAARGAGRGRAAHPRRHRPRPAGDSRAGGRVGPRSRVRELCRVQLRGQGRRRPDGRVRVNACGVNLLARACADAGVKLVHFSTDYVFGQDAARTAPLTEDDAPGPVSWYGKGKLSGEGFALAAAPAHLVIRTCGLYGVWGSGGKGGNFVETMLRLAGQGKPLRVVNDQRCTPSYTADVADATVAAHRPERDRVVSRHEQRRLHLVRVRRRDLPPGRAETPISRRSPAPSSGPPPNAPRTACCPPRSSRPSAFPPCVPWQDALAAYLAERRNKPV